MTWFPALRTDRPMVTGSPPTAEDLHRVVANFTAGRPITLGGREDAQVLGRIPAARVVLDGDVTVLEVEIPDDLLAALRPPLSPGYDPDAAASGLRERLLGLEMTLRHLAYLPPPARHTLMVRQRRGYPALEVGTFDEGGPAPPVYQLRDAFIPRAVRVVLAVTDPGEE